ncbi:MAG: oxygen-dependent coproporphyrinogen oxidase [Pseudarcicella sp.]|jgi:coproporphyrinogen III oxidase|nr:oxygen-dependent coproporphyrinogen oxidase [Pseudarcicella sp.]MBP6409536.1 oxygen-dependent coproporphyrinogen oxidase [Pseudarcicella sp.]
MTKLEISERFKELQNNICNALEKTDTLETFSTDIWERSEGGGGISKVIQKGKIIEKGGVMYSAVWGDLHPKLLDSMGLNEQLKFYATGVSIVIHPKNPHVPIIHMNVRYFEMDNGIFWFGGGIDLTPHYVVEQDAVFFHNTLKNVCDAHDKTYYDTFKKWADDYFYNQHRHETRGIGGIFFDYLKPDSNHTKEQLFDFVYDVGNTFAKIYTHFMTQNNALPYTENEKQFQLMRRGRYVEFNLVYDRGTKFGLETNGRTESILMSMPPLANWTYDYKAQKNSPEEYTLSKLVKGINWI